MDTNIKLAKFLTYLSILLLALPKTTQSQESCHNEADKRYPILFQGLETAIVISEIPYTDTSTVGDTLIILQLDDCYGAANVEVYSILDTTLLIQGQFTSSLGLLREHVKNENLLTGKLTMTIYEYYEGLRHGVWTYSIPGMPMKKNIYDHGILKQSTKL